MGFLKKGFLAAAALAAVVASSGMAQASMQILGLTGRQYSMPSGAFLGYLVAWSDEHIAQASIAMPCDTNTNGTCVLTLTTPAFQSGNYSAYIFNGTSDLQSGESITGTITGDVNLTNPAATSSASKTASCKPFAGAIFCY